MIAMSEQAKDTVEFYCVKCRYKMIPVKGSVEREIKPKGADILRAICSFCGGKMCKFVKRQGP